MLRNRKCRKLDINALPFRYILLYWFDVTCMSFTLHHHLKHRNEFLTQISEHKNFTNFFKGIAGFACKKNGSASYTPSSQSETPCLISRQKCTFKSLFCYWSKTLQWKGVLKNLSRQEGYQQEILCLCQFILGNIILKHIPKVTFCRSQKLSLTNSQRPVFFSLQLYWAPIFTSHNSQNWSNLEKSLEIILSIFLASAGMEYR